MNRWWGMLLVATLTGCGSGGGERFAADEDPSPGAGGAVAETAATGGAGTVGAGGETAATGAGGATASTGGVATNGAGGVSAAGGSVSAAGGATSGTGGAAVSMGAGGAVVAEDAGPGKEADAGKLPVTEDAGASCVCSAGACCDGCHFKAFGALCGVVVTSSFCTTETGPTATSIAVADHNNVFCSGVSPECDGHQAHKDETWYPCDQGHACVTDATGSHCS